MSIDNSVDNSIDNIGKIDHWVYLAEDAPAVLAAKLKGISKQMTGQGVLRVEVAIEKIDAIKWLAAQPQKIKIYFSGREKNDRDVAAIGAADEIFEPENLDYASVFARMHKYLSLDYPNLKYYGGFAFAPGHVDDDWQSFGACHLIMPRFELLVNHKLNHTILACNVIKEKDSIPEILAELQHLDFETTPEFHSPGPPLSRTNTPDHDTWINTLNQTIENIKQNRFKKTVLARKVELAFSTPLNPVALLSFLKNMSAGRYAFLFQFDSCCAFVGSSPERLYKRHGRHILSEAVAGTRSRGKEAQDDLQLATELMNSDKEQREHDFVLHTIESTLKPLCDLLEVEQKKGLLKLKEGQHLITHFNGELNDNVTDAQLLAALHPTPAVGGCPLQEALHAITIAEPFKRGWYAGVIGAVGLKDVDFAVGLRCGRTHHHHLALYSGVGIVAGSEPEMEWQEVEYKISHFLDIINQNPQ